MSQWLLNVRRETRRTEGGQRVSNNVAPPAIDATGNTSMFLDHHQTRAEEYRRQGNLLAPNNNPPPVEVIRERQQVQVSNEAPPPGGRDHTSGFLFQHLQSARGQPVSLEVVPPPSQDRSETDLVGVRESLFRGKSGALERELESLELALVQVKDKPTLAGVRHVRELKEKLDSKSVLNQSLLENVLAVSQDGVHKSAVKAAGTAQYNLFENRLGEIEVGIRECEKLALEKAEDSGHGRPGGAAHIERLPLPKFSRDALKYADFKKLFQEL